MKDEQIKKWNDQTQEERKKSKINLILFSIFILILIFIVIATCVGPSSQAEDDKETVAEDSLPIVHNSNWDGSVRQVKDFLKENLNDPDSYEAVTWSPVQQNPDNHDFIVRHKYRARNGFGGLMIYDQIFTLDSLGDVINVSDCE